MIKSLTFSLLVLSTLVLSAQVNWEKLDPHNFENVELIHTDDNLMMGRLQYPPTLLASQDLGANWNVISTIPEQRRIPLVRKKFDGNYFILFDEQVSSWSPGSNTITPFISLGSGTWTTIAPLPNGNLLVAGVSEALRLYDQNGSLLKTLPTDRIQEIIVVGNDEIYFFQGNPFGNAVKINSNLDILASGPDGLYVSDHFIYDGGRFYNSRSYSADGLVWKDYANDLDGVITILNNGDVHMVGDCAYSSSSNLCDKIYISSDQGETFQFAGDLGFEFTLGSAGSINFRNDTYVGTLAVGQSGVLMYDAGKSYYSADGVTNWTLQTYGEGKPYAFGVEAATKENVFASADGDRYRVSDADNWSDVDPSEICDGVGRFESLANGTFINPEGCRSTDGGVTWTGGNLDSWGIYVKDGIVYTTSRGTLHYSRDNGTTWSSNVLPVLSMGWDFFVEAQVFDISSTGFIYMDSYQDGGGTKKYDLQGNVLSNILNSGGVIDTTGYIEENIWDLKTSYSGSDVYVISRDSLDTYRFRVSLDDGVTFVEKTYPANSNDFRTRLVVDGDGGVFIYNETEVWMSRDKGSSWQDISPVLDTGVEIRDFDVSWDGYAFVATIGSGILRSSQPVSSGPTPEQPSVFQQYPWLEGVVDNQNCAGTSVTTYSSGIYEFLYVETTDGGVLYFQDGTLYCTDSQNFNCVAAYGLTDVSATWNCDQTGGGGGGVTPDWLDDFPFLSNEIDFSDCQGTQVSYYDFGSYGFIYVENTDGGVLYLNDGTLYCTDGPGLDCRMAYGLTTPTELWSCGSGGGNPSPMPMIFVDYPWLDSVVDRVNCTGRVSVYAQGIYLYVFVEEAGETTMYNASGQFYCMDSPGFSCFSAYGFSDSDLVDSWECEGIQDNELENRNSREIGMELKVYPNPSTGSMTILTPNVGGKAEIRDMNGRLISEQVISTEETLLDLNHLDGGIYMIVLEKENQRIMERWVKI